MILVHFQFEEIYRFFKRIWIHEFLGFAFYFKRKLPSTKISLQINCFPVLSNLNFRGFVILVISHRVKEAICNSNANCFF